MGVERNAWSESGPDVICLEGNGSRPSHKGDGWIVGGAMYTLNSTEVHAVCYVIGSYHSNAWKSPNPNSGVYRSETARTLDWMNCGYPACNQGGVAIVQYDATETVGALCAADVKGPGQQYVEAGKLIIGLE